MKKILLSIFFAAISVSSFAQTRAMGIRVGVSGFEADYQHTFAKNQFLECCFGIDFGYLGAGSLKTPADTKTGMKATGTYNFIWARPAWTNEGSWALYAGAGATTGYVHDDVHYTTNDGINIANFQSHGFMLGICAQVGVEYTFKFPLQLSIDLRPTLAMHVNAKTPYLDPTKPEAISYHKVRAGLYDNGLLGFAPSISARYRF